jgi:hypothetical protein
MIIGIQVAEDQCILFQCVVSALFDMEKPLLRTLCAPGFPKFSPNSMNSALEFLFLYKKNVIVWIVTKLIQ